MTRRLTTLQSSNEKKLTIHYLQMNYNYTIYKYAVTTNIC